jgi:hypothetical protein
VYGVILIAMLFLMPTGAGGFLANIWRKIGGARGSGPNQPRIARGVDLTGSLARADRLPVGGTERAEP